MSKRPLSRARATEVDGIVAGIVDLMVRGQWVPGTSHRAVAEREGVSVERVKDWAAEAGRTLRILAMVDADDLKARNQARLDALAADAHAAGEYGDAVRAIAEQNKLLGLHAPAKLDITVQTFGQMPPERQLEEIDKRIEALQRHRSRLLQAMSVPALPAGGDE